MTSPGIHFAGVSKKFFRGERHDSLRSLIPATVRRLLGRGPKASELENQEFWAVRDLSFDVKPGEALGIIGPNGAGKSTTLKLLTRILRPTLGTVDVRGRAGALIEVSAGFHPDLTGRENVYLQGAIMGMKRAQIRAHFDSIVDFAGIGEFIDTPVKRYSSGMNARLGFAIAAHLDPDVMIIDEVLSVGDAAFQERCTQRMLEMVKSGVPVVFVSHNLPAVLELCTRVIVVNKGTKVYEGPPADAIQFYRSSSRPAVHGYGSGGPIRIVGVDFLENGRLSNGILTSNSDCTIRIRYEASEPVPNPHFAVDIVDSRGTTCFGTGSLQQCSFGTLDGSGAVDLRIPRLALQAGSYVLSAGIHRADIQHPYDFHFNAYPFSVTGGNRDLGIVALERRWELRDDRTVAAHPTAKAV